MAADRKQTPDILGSLLDGKKEDKDTIKPEYHKDSKPVKHKDSKTALQPTRRPVSQSTSKTDKTATKPDKAVRESPEPVREPSGEKLKATYYLAVEAVDSLEEGWYQLRRMASTEARTGISKSLIVETALQIALEELEKSGQKSRIAMRLLE
jgi:hypothetical protein